MGLDIKINEERGRQSREFGTPAGENLGFPRWGASEVSDKFSRIVD